MQVPLSKSICLFNYASELRGGGVNGPSASEVGPGDVGPGKIGPGDAGPGEFGPGVASFLDDKSEFHKILTLRLPGVGVGDMPPWSPHGAPGALGLCNPFLRGGGGIRGVGAPVSVSLKTDKGLGLGLDTPVPRSGGR